MTGSEKQQKAERYKLLTGLFFRLLPYQILLIVINAVNGIVDSLYASNVIGEKAMSAIGLYGPLNHFLYAAGIMLVSGSQILYGRYLVQDRKRIHSIFTVNILVSLGISALTAGVMVLAALTNLTRVFTEQQPELQMLNQYMLGQAIGIPALIVGQQLFAFLSLENQTRRTMTASILCFLVNAILDHLFIAVFSLGTFGLGLSSALASWVFLGIQAVYYIKGRSEWKFTPRACRWSDAPEICRLGYVGAISRFVEMFRCLIVNFLVLRYVGSVGLSSFAASNALLAVIWAVPFGMVAVSRMLFSISIGEADRRSLVDVMRIALTRGMGVMLCIVALLVLLAEPLTQLFYRDPANPVYHMTVMGFRLLPLCMPLAMVSLHFASYAQTMEKKPLSIVLPVIDGAGGVVLCSLILIPLMQMNGLYLSNILNGVICFAVVALFARLALKRMPRSLEDLMAIPESFGASEDERMDLSVRSMDEVIAISGQVMEFCRKRGIDERRAYYAGLCMEEMAGNVVQHGFTKDRKAHSIDLRIVHKGNDVIMRIRDNCTAFNPTERASALELGDDFRNIGIHLAFRAASHVSYQNLLGLNVLTIRI